jgi:hypothetical protein
VTPTVKGELSSFVSTQVRFDPVSELVVVRDHRAPASRIRTPQTMSERTRRNRRGEVAGVDRLP